MKLFDLDRWSEVLTAITRNKWRSFMTAMGVFWGLFMLIIMLGSGAGHKKMLLSNITTTTNSGYVFFHSTSVEYKGLPRVRSIKGDYNDIIKIKKEIEGVDLISRYVSSKRVKAFNGDKITNARLYGYEPTNQVLDPLVIIYGRYINDLDVLSTRKTCVLGENIYKALFPKGGDPCGETIIIGNNMFTVIGVAKPFSQNGMNSIAGSSVIISITLMQKMYNTGSDLAGFMFSAKDGYSASNLSAKIDSRLRKVYNIAPNDRQAMFMNDNEEQFSKFENLFSGISLLTWFVGLGTLLAGVIGVSNIMLIVVKERTQEIGVRRALGAKPIDIFMQIMSEGFILTFITGVMSLGASVGLLTIAEEVLKAMPNSSGASFSPQISFKIAMIAAGVIILSGLISGIIPTMRAIKIKAVDAIREE